MSLPATGIITLGGITLPDDTVLRGLRTPTVAVDQQRSKGGVLIALVNRLDGGRTLELEGTFPSSTVEALRAIEGNEVSLVHPRGTFAVMLVDLSGLEPVFEHVEYDAADWEQGSIIILER